MVKSINIKQAHPQGLAKLRAPLKKHLGMLHGRKVLPAVHPLKTPLALKVAQPASHLPVAVKVAQPASHLPVLAPQQPVIEKPEDESSRKFRLQVAERTVSSLITSVAVESVAKCCLLTVAIPSFVGSMVETACERYIGKESTLAKVACITAGTMAATCAVAVTGAAAPIIGGISYVGSCALRYVGWSLLNGIGDLAKSASSIFS